MQTNYARMQQTGQPFLSCPVLFWDLCCSHFCITSSSRCDADDGVNPMETVRLMLYRFLPFFSASRRTAPTVQSLRVCLAMENLLSKTLKWTESEMNGYCRFADLTVVLILNGKLKFQPCNFGKVADIELIGDFDVKNRKFSVQEDLRVAIGT